MLLCSSGSHFTLSRWSPQISLENDYLGPRRIDALKKEDLDWQKKAQEAVLNIQEFTVKYFEITARAQKGRVCWHFEWTVCTHMLTCRYSASAGLRVTSVRFWTARLMWFSVNEAVDTTLPFTGTGANEDNVLINQRQQHFASLPGLCTILVTVISFVYWLVHLLSQAYSI